MVFIIITILILDFKTGKYKEVKLNYTTLLNHYITSYIEIENLTELIQKSIISI